jgi:rhamnosyltransferase
MIDKIGSIVITYNPNESFVWKLEKILEQTKLCIIVDNNSTNWLMNFYITLQKKLNVLFIKNKKNLGIGTALNQGLNELKKHNYSWAVTYDQDSWPGTNMVDSMHNTFLQHLHYNDKIYAVVPNIIEENMPWVKYKWLVKHETIPFFFKRISCDASNLENSLLAITSGMMINLEAYKVIGKFKEDFFIDYVDTEFCLRARSKGFRFLVSSNATLYHNLGQKKEFSFYLLKIRPTFHNYQRRYYISRNRVFLIKSFGKTYPFWLTYDFCSFFYSIFRIIMFEDDKRNKLYHSILGTIDGLRGKTGAKF